MGGRDSQMDGYRSNSSLRRMRSAISASFFCSIVGGLWFSFVMCCYNFLNFQAESILIFSVSLT